MTDIVKLTYPEYLRSGGECWTFLSYERVISNFRNFRYRGNQGRSRMNFTNNVKLADFELPPLVQASSTPVKNFQIFVTITTMVAV